MLQNDNNFNMSVIFGMKGLKIIGYGNPENNLESPCISNNIKDVGGCSCDRT
jgi:hypothetical protein